MKKDGTVWTWGLDNRYKDAVPTEDSVFSKPQKCFSDAKYIALHNRKSCAIMNNGDLYIWGGGFAEMPEDDALSWENPLMIAEKAVQTAEIPGGLLILKEDHSLWSWNKSTIGSQPEAAQKLMDHVSFCSYGIILTDSGEVLIWNQLQNQLLLNPDNVPEDFFHTLTGDALYAQRTSDNIRVINANGRLLNISCRRDTDGNETYGNPRIIMFKINSPY